MRSEDYLSLKIYKDKYNFEKFKLLQSGIEPVIVCINGFLTKKDEEKNSDKWLKSIKKFYPDNEIRHLTWDSKRLLDIGKNLLKLSGTSSVAGLLIGSITLISSPISIALSSYLIKNNIWKEATKNAYGIGRVLSDIIIETDKKFILIGHSLGSKVIYSCLDSLSVHKKKYIKDIHLLGGAVDNNNTRIERKFKDETSKKDYGKELDSWYGLDKAISGKIYNYYSKDDLILKFLYRLGESTSLKFGKPIGRHKINNENINNIDLTGIVKGHSDYHDLLKNILFYKSKKNNIKLSNFLGNK